MNLRLNYIFQEVDGQLNALVKIQTEIQSIINHDLKELDEWSKRSIQTKTEIMLFTNLEHPEINFMFEDNIILTIESDRHLGVTFSTDAKWNAHIENIVSISYGN